MEKAIRNKAFRSSIVWLAVAALTATGLVYLVQRNGLNPFEGPRGLGDIELLAQTSTITLVIQSQTPLTVTFRANIGPTDDACDNDREVTLFRDTATGSAPDTLAGTGTTPDTGNSGNVDITTARVPGNYYAVVAEDAAKGCSAATSNLVAVTAPAP